MIIHTVQPGETIASIARYYGVNAERLIEENGLLFPERLVVGQALVILFPREIHEVKEGDSLYEIAKRYRTTINQLYRNNPFLGGNPMLRVGDRLVVQYKQNHLGEAQINGYAYPFINFDLLKATLPYMSFIMPFTYEINADGTLLAPDDAAMIQAANDYGVAPIMNLSNLREPDGFDSDLAHQVLSDAVLQGRVIEATMQTIQEKGYAGLDVDFEYVYEEDRYLFADFIRKLRMRLAPLDMEVFVAVAAKTSDDEKGVLTAGHDYQALGEAADGVLLMTYEWGYRYGPPMAIAPIGNVRQVLDYAVTRMEPEKIFLGVPNYGYDWPLPFEQGVTAAHSISNVEAITLAADNGVAIDYSITSQAPFFYYEQEGTTHQVWFEDAKSIRAKLELIAEYGLRGAGYWNLMRPFQANWSVLNAMYGILQK